MKLGESVQIPAEQRREILDQLREARAQVLSDAEAFPHAATAVEHIGKHVGRKIGTGFECYKNEVLNLVATTRAERGQVESLFHRVRLARNDAVHNGAYARHLSSRLIELLLVIEEAIVEQAEMVRDLMVRDPLVAEPWHSLEKVRVAMLSNSFSYLPTKLKTGGDWVTVSDFALVKYLERAIAAVQSSGKEKRIARRLVLARTLAESVDDALEVATAEICGPGDRIASLKSKLGETPTLVLEEVAGEDRLIGIVAPFDLL